MWLGSFWVGGELFWGAMVVFEVRVPFERAELAEMVLSALAVDAELREDVVARAYRRDDRALVAVFSGANPKILRTCVSSFFDMLLVAVKTAERFDPERKQLH